MYDVYTDNNMSTEKNKEQIIHFINRLHDIVDNITIALYRKLMGLYKYNSLDEVKSDLDKTYFIFHAKRVTLEKKLYEVQQKIIQLEFDDMADKYIKVSDNYNLDNNTEYYDLVDNKFIRLGTFKEYTKRSISIMVDRGKSIQEINDFALFENGTCLNLEFSSGIQLYKRK
jgi:hypothetical protein